MRIRSLSAEAAPADASGIEVDMSFRKILQREVDTSGAVVATTPMKERPVRLIIRLTAVADGWRIRSTQFETTP